MTAPFPHKRFRWGLSLAIALLMAVLSFGLEFHHHDDGDNHDDCPLCIALHQAQAASLNPRPAVVPVPLVVSGCTPLPENNAFISALVKVPVIRPPPPVH